MGSAWSHERSRGSESRKSRSQHQRRNDVAGHRRSKNKPTPHVGTHKVRPPNNDDTTRGTTRRKSKHRRKPSNQGTTSRNNVLGIELCEECGQFDWAKFARSELPSKLTTGGRLVIAKGTKEQLTSSSCEICRFLGQFIATEGQKARVRLRLSGFTDRVPPRAMKYKVSEKENATLEVGGLLGGGLARVHRKEFGLRYAFNKQDEWLPEFPEPQIVPAMTDYSRIRRWLEFCDRFHDKECFVSKKDSLPGFRVIDCHTNQIVDQDAKSCRYVALSYVWGAAGGSSNDNSAFPATISDSIKVSVALGFRYLWVDRYCINQDNAAEKHVQIHLMDRIYMQAELTIFAAAGNGSDYGLPGVSKMARVPQQRLKIGEMELVEIFDSVDDISNSIWASRAWTYQEGSMSKRRLIFTEKEVVFLCSRMYCQESILMGLRRNLGLWDGLDSYRFLNVIPRIFDNPNRYGLKDIQGILTEYTSRSISYDTDALNACRGILNALHTTHCWGAPIEVVPESEKLTMNIYWRSKKPGRRRVHFPSWSWAGYSGPKGFRPLGTTSDAFEVQIGLEEGGWQAIGDYMKTHRGKGEITAGKRLRILGQVAMPKFVDQAWRDRYVPSLRGERHRGFYAKLPCARNIDSFFELYLDDEEFDHRTLSDAIALLIEGGQKSPMTQVLLILKPKGNVYTRVGITNWFGMYIDRSRGIVSLADKPVTPLWMKQLEDRVIYLE